MTTERYISILNKLLVDFGRARGGDQDNRWFQQDGEKPSNVQADPYMAGGALGERVISRMTSHPWLPNSPDLTSLDFDLWGYLNMKVFKCDPQNLAELKRTSRGKSEGSAEKRAAKFFVKQGSEQNYATQKTFFSSTCCSCRVVECEDTGPVAKKSPRSVL